MKKINKIKRNDYNRILITETLPFETPIIFSNDGLYNQIANVESADSVQKTIIRSLILGQDLPNSVNSTHPYSYKVRKNYKEFRKLTLLHPISQWKIKTFYEKYEQLILYHCGRSGASLRAPVKIAGSFYNKSSWENINQYKKNAVALTSLDRYVKHTPSYFAYGGHDRLYKFFNSKEYFALEKKFPVLSTLDVAKCFDSIYTHSLSWAVKDKEFTKVNVRVASTFAQEFDETIRHGNHDETNGIPIGPEASRIFAEIIFQEVDVKTIEKLRNLKFGFDYAFRRYVDDVFIFATSIDIAHCVYEAYADVLVSFNLHANTAKSTIYQRPFVTTKSKLIFEAGMQTNDFIAKFLDEPIAGKLVPKRVFSPWRLTKSYVDAVKSLCSANSAGYDDVASFLISVMAERIKKLVNGTIKEGEADAEQDYVAAIEVLSDVLFFLYSVAPSVSASYKFSTSLILMFRFAKKNLPSSSASISHRLYTLATRLLLDQCTRPQAENVEGFVNLEYLNVALAIRELGDDHLLSTQILDDLFVRDRRLSYFTIVSCLFYVRGDEQYKSIRKKVLRAAASRLSDISDIFKNSEKAYLLLDLISCPFVPDSHKRQWVSAFYGVLKKSPPSNVELDDFLASACDGCWQIDWKDVDLLNSLEKKELKQAY